MARTALVEKLTRVITQKVRASKLWTHAEHVVGPARKKRPAPQALDHLPCFEKWSSRIRTEPLVHALRIESAQWINTFREFNLEDLLPNDQKERTDEIRKWKKTTLPSCQKMGPLRCPLYTAGKFCAGGSHPKNICLPPPVFSEKTSPKHPPH